MYLYQLSLKLAIASFLSILSVNPNAQALSWLATMELMYIIAELLIIFFLGFIIVIFGYSLLRGAPYAALSKKRLNSMIKLLDIKPGQSSVDLGSGDARIVIELAKLGVKAYGYEINPLLVFISRRNIKKAGLEHKAKIYWKNYWSSDLSRYDIITVYGIPHMMKRLEKKLSNELKSGARVASNHFPFPTWQPRKKLGNVYLYQR